MTVYNYIKCKSHNKDNIKKVKYLQLIENDMFRINKTNLVSFNKSQLLKIKNVQRGISSYLLNDTIFIFVFLTW